ncbi:MAG: formylglycine-generating enzyme family protein [Methylotetracoccus sp.]
MFPFNIDVARLIDQLQRLRGGSGMEIRTLLRGPGGAVLEGRKRSVHAAPWRMPPAGTVVVILSDLGLYDEIGAAAREWLAFGHRLRAAGCQAIAIMPVPPRLVLPAVRACFDCYAWDRHSRFQPLAVEHVLEPAACSDDDRPAEMLLALLSPALQVEPALLRAVRHLLPADRFDVGTEARVWLSPSVEVTPLGFQLRVDAIERLHSRFADLAKQQPELVAEVCALIVRHHAGSFPTQRYEEIETISRLTGRSMGRFSDEARQHWAELTKAFDRHADHDGLAAWGEYHLAAQGLQHSYAHALWAILARRRSEDKREIPDGVDQHVALPFLIDPAMPQTFGLWQRGLFLEFRPNGSNGQTATDLKAGSQLGSVRTTSRQIVHVLESPDGKTRTQVLELSPSSPLRLPLAFGEIQHIHAAGVHVTVAPMTKPSWAVAIGQDASGLFIEVIWLGNRFRLLWEPPGVPTWDDVPSKWDELPSTWDQLGSTRAGRWRGDGPVGWDEFGLYADLRIGEVTQRFRWIEPGTFRMGSPGDEPDRLGDETQHEVTLTRGFWLADTACTQALWVAVMNSNSSEPSDDPLKPIQNVSWDGVAEFISRLNARVDGLNARLPTEAEWEYSCRAGTQTPFAFGATVTPDQVNFDGAANGMFRGSTVPVKSLPANAWGLYEMHGNVWEWCADWYGQSGPNSVTDPLGPAAPFGGPWRVVKGGAWNLAASYARSASRAGTEHSETRGNSGFRLALGQASTGQAAERPQAEAPGRSAASERGGRAGRRPSKSR